MPPDDSPDLARWARKTWDCGQTTHARPVRALAEKLDIPVGFHTGLAEAGDAVSRVLPRLRVALGRPLAFEELLVRRPKLRVYLMHAGHPFADETIAILSMYPQVYVEVGAIDWIIPRPSFHAFLRRLVEAGFSNRIMFGSDQGVWPESSPWRSNPSTEPSPTAAQKRDIFYNNAARFFRLGAQRAATLERPFLLTPPRTTGSRQRLKPDTTLAAARSG